MRLFVIQHAVQASPVPELESLAAEALAAAASGADVIVLPRVAEIQQGYDVPREVREALAAIQSEAYLVPFGWHGGDLEPTPLGSTAVLTGDEALDVDLLDRLFVAKPDALLIRPASESALQAEAFIEHAIALSTSVAPLVVLVEPVGMGEDGELAWFGGSIVAVDGDVVAEAESESETEVLEVALGELPTFAGVRERRPMLPGVLAQRWAHHHGTRAPIDYPAELT